MNPRFPSCQIVERGERILHPALLDWVDDDYDGIAPLQFNFYQPIKVRPLDCLVDLVAFRLREVEYSLDME